MIAACLTAIFISFMVTLCAARLMVRAGVNDIPVARSNHKRSTPTAGGVGVLCGIAAGFLSLSFFGLAAGHFPNLPAVLSLCFFIAFLGLYDDLYSPPTALKFGIFVGTAILLIYVLDPVKALLIWDTTITLPVFIATLGTILWIFVAMNSVNFMDGANGLMPGCMAIAFAGLAGLALKMQAYETFWMCVVAAAGWLGFLPLNFRRNALIFAGDIGALLAGFMYAAAIMLLINETSSASAAYLGVLILLPFLTDVLLTLLWRLRQKRDLSKPHKDHLYQRAISSGLSHTQISLIYYGAFLICAALAFMASNVNPALVSTIFVSSVIGLSALYFIGGKFWRFNMAS